MENRAVFTERARDGRLGFVILNRPHKANAWNQELVDGLKAAFEEFKNEKGVHVVIVKGAGKHFSAGFEFDLLENGSGDDILHFFYSCAWLRPLMHSMPQITIAAVHGTAAALGTHLTNFCDLAIASEDAFFGAPPINVGFACTWAEPVFRQQGTKWINEFMFLGTMINAEQALRLGMINRVVPRDKLDEAAMQMADKLLSKNVKALARGKKLAYSQAEMTLDAAIESGCTPVPGYAQCEDVREGIRAFLEKRAPNYKQ